MDDIDKKRLISHVGVRGNVRYITITDNVPDHWESLISIAKTNYSWWAYIYHDKDDTDKHLHLLCYDKGGTSLKAHCARFSSVVESNFVCKVYNPRAMARYLIHKDNPEKYQYDIKLVETNSKDRLMSFFVEQDSDVLQQYHDYCDVVNGLMSPEEFFEKYRGDLNSTPFHHRCSLFHKLSHAHCESFRINYRKEEHEARGNKG